MYSCRGFDLDTLNSEETTNVTRCKMSLNVNSTSPDTNGNPDCEQIVSENVAKKNKVEQTTTIESVETGSIKTLS